MTAAAPLAGERVPTASLSTHPSNARQGDVGAISESLREHGQYRPIVVQKSTRHVIAWNHTLLAARALGWSEIDVVWLDVDDEAALRVLLVDNRTNDLASYDNQALADLLVSLAQQTERGLGGTGFDRDDLDCLLADLAAPGSFMPTSVDPPLIVCPECGHEWTLADG